MAVQRICVIGAGTMGTGIAQAAAQSGLRVHLLDTSQEALHRSREMLERSLHRGIERGRLSPDEAAAVRRLVSWEQAWQVLSEADWVIEAVTEILDVKREVLQHAARMVRPEVPVATNTLALPVDALADAFGRPERFLGMHFFNPAPAMRLVLIDPGSRTLPEVVDAAVELARAMGKEPRTSMEVPRQVVNRTFGALVTSAIELLDEGADAEAIDTAIELAMGHAMGPLRTADMMGLDVVLSMLQSMYELTGEERYRPPDTLVRKVQAGRLGRKTGEGFYRYAERD